MDKKNFQPAIFEIILAGIVFISVLFNLFHFYELIFPEPNIQYPFKEYYHNPGIIYITIISFFSRLFFIYCFFLLILKRTKYSRKILAFYLLSATIIGFLQWYELYHGATFYYGEVRDKQGLDFPFLASLMFTLVVWKLNYSSDTKRNLLIKLVVTGILNACLIFLWNIVYEPWKLWQL